MAKFPKGVQGSSAEDATKRLDDALERVDEGQRLAFELGARIEKAKAGTLGHERGRLARKYGDGSAEALRAEVALSRQSLALEAAVAETQRARIALSPLDEETIRVHGRVVDRKRAGIAGIDARLVDAHGKALAKAATDENGYFRLDVKPRAKSSRAKAAGRRIVLPPEAAKAASADASGAAKTATAAAAAAVWELVLRRGQQELFREAIRDLAPGQAVYREPVLDKQ